MTSLDKETFEECMTGVLCYIEKRQQRQYLQDNLVEQDTSTIFENAFNCVTIRYSLQTRFYWGERKLELIFCGLLSY